MPLPSGTVTFCFTDIEGSTAILRKLGPDRYGELLSEHRRLLRHAWTSYGGHEIGTEGDAFLVVFSRPSDALRAAAEAQRALSTATWPDDVEVRVRVGVHTGEAMQRDGDYVGLAVHRGARVAAAAHGGQVLVSDATRALVSNEDLAGLALRSLGEHRLKDLAAGERLYQLTGNGLASEFPPPRTLDTCATNLPVVLTPFLGRERELRELEQLVRRDGARLVTLTGPGGVGKTRLALQLAAELIDDFQDGAYVCFLAAVTEAPLVLPAVARALSLREQPGQSLDQVLADYLRERRLLLAVDNLEHLLDAAAELSQLLRRAPGLSLIATSRAPLRVAGEHEYAVPPLAEDEGRALFTARARMVRPDVDAAADQEVIAAICNRLDRLPLAIELAAARVRSLPPRTLLARLGSSLTILTAGARDVEERQRTLRATIDWSYRLLSPDEQAVLRRLAVFYGGLMLRAAEAVCDLERHVATPLFDIVDGLVEKSLVRSVPPLGGEPRFMLLETIREYAAEKLADAAESDIVRERHASWYAMLAEKLSPDEHGIEQLRAEHENLLGALEWLIDAGRVDQSFRLLDRLSDFWDAEGLVEEGERWAARALTAEAGTPEARATAISVAALFACRRGSYDEAAEEIARARALVAAAQSEDAVMAVENTAGVVAWSRGDLLEAEIAFRRALSWAHKLGAEEAEGVGRANLGKVLAEAGKWEEAEAVLTEAVEWTASAKLERAHAWALCNLATLALERGDTDRARLHLRDSLEIQSRVFNAFEFLQSLQVAARLANDADPSTAACLWSAEATLRERFKIRFTPRERARLDEHRSKTRAQLDPEVFAAGCAEGRAMTIEEARKLAFAATGAIS